MKGSDNSLVHARVRASAAFLALCLGVWLAILGPHYAARQALNSLRTDLVEVQNQADEIVATSASRGWFLPSYNQTVLTDGSVCQQRTRVLQDSMRDFKDVSDSGALALVEKKRALLVDASAFCKKALGERIRQDTARSTARGKLATLHADRATLSSAHANRLNQRTAMVPLWLPKYIAPLSEELNRNTDSLISVREFLGRAELLLPLNTTKGSGDPDTALTILAKAETLLASTAQAELRLTRRLDYLSEAMAQAEARTEAAAEKLDQARQILRGTLSETGYKIALAPFSVRIDAAERQRNDASEALVTRDWLVAYESAKLAHAAAGSVITDIRTLVALAQENSRAISKYRNRQAEVQSFVRGAEDLMRVLKQHHDQSEWSAIRDNPVLIGRAQGTLATSIAAAADANSTRRQQFTDASRHLQDANRSYNRAHALYRELWSRTNALEGYRSRWDQKSEEADSAIERESSQITQYGDYNDEAVSEFKEAVSEYNTAIAAARVSRYASAIEYADAAIHTVCGVGDDAETAYEEDRARKEALARAAAEALLSASSDSDDSSLSGYSSNSGDSSSSNSQSSNDGSDWDNDSRSDDGDDW